MIDGNVNEFVAGLYYGDERWFKYNGIKFFIQGWVQDNAFTLVLEQMEPEPISNKSMWSDTKFCDKRSLVIEKFLQARLFDGKTFWEVEQEIEWVDC